MKIQKETLKWIKVGAVIGAVVIGLILLLVHLAGGSSSTVNTPIQDEKNPEPAPVHKQAVQEGSSSSNVTIGSDELILNTVTSIIPIMVVLGLIGSFISAFVGRKRRRW